MNLFTFCAFWGWILPCQFLSNLSTLILWTKILGGIAASNAKTQAGRWQPCDCLIDCQWSFERKFGPSFGWNLSIWISMLAKCLPCRSEWTPSMLDHKYESIEAEWWKKLSLELLEPIDTLRVRGMQCHFSRLTVAYIFAGRISSMLLLSISNWLEDTNPIEDDSLG